MPQACIYLDETTMAHAREQAQRGRVSLSRHIAMLIEERQQATRWPDSFFAAFGALADTDFEAPPEVDWELDRAREDFWR